MTPSLTSAPEALTASWKMRCRRGRVMPFMPGIAVTEERWRGHRAQHVALAVVEPRPLDREPLGDRRLPQAELVERADGVPGLDDPDAVDVPLRVELDDVDLDARLAQRDRGREPADPAADDEDSLDGGHQLKSPVAAFVSSAVSGANSTGGNDSNIEWGIPRFL